MIIYKVIDANLLKGIQLYNEIGKLPEKCKAVYLMSRKHNLTNREIAERLAISENTVVQHVRKVLGRLPSSPGHYLEVAIALHYWGGNAMMDYYMTHSIRKPNNI